MRGFIALIIIAAIGFGAYWFWQDTQLRLRTTSEGLVRKVVVRSDNTPLYDSSDQENRIGRARQWDIYFIFGESESHYIVGSDMYTVPDPPLYIARNAVFEWNSYLALDFVNSPDTARRDPVQYYATQQGASTSSGIPRFSEKESHQGDFTHGNAQLVISEFPEDVYYVAFLYDDCDEDGECVFLGNYDWAYVQFTENAHGFRRYVSRADLQSQIQLLLGMEGQARRDMDPGELDVYGDLCQLLAMCDNTGAQDIARAFAGDDVPDAAQEGIFAEDVIGTGRRWMEIDPELDRMISRMRSYYNNSRIWNSGYSFVPAEWMN